MSRRSCVVSGPILLCGLALAAAALAGTPAGKIYVQTVKLTAGAEHPTGDRTANGVITVCISKERGSIDFNFDVLNIAQQPTAGHIHKGAPGTSGPVVFPFAQPGLIDPSTGEVEWADNAPANPGLIAALLAGPKGYYVNVHTRSFPNGAIRGQMGNWKLVAVDSQAALECGVGD
jgi:CHRD domain